MKFKTRCLGDKLIPSKIVCDVQSCVNYSKIHLQRVVIDTFSSLFLLPDPKIVFRIYINQTDTLKFQLSNLFCLPQKRIHIDLIF